MPGIQVSFRVPSIFAVWHPGILRVPLLFAVLIVHFVPYVQPAVRIILPLLFIHLAVLGKGQLGGKHPCTSAFMAVNLFPSGYCCNAAALWADKYFHHMFFLTSNFVFLIHSIVALNWKKGKFWVKQSFFCFYLWIRTEMQGRPSSRRLGNVPAN